MDKSTLMELVENGHRSFRRLKDGMLEPAGTHKRGIYRQQQPCATHGPYDAGMDGHCIHCYKKIAPPMIIIIEDWFDG